MTKDLKKISSYTVTAGHYVADACIIWCYDERFRPSLEAFIRAKEISHHDLVSIAGGSKTLAKPASEDCRNYLLTQIKISIDLHHAKRVYLMMHEDCGACGGSKAFGNDCKVEEKELRAMLEAARESVRAFLKNTPHSSVPVDMILVKFDGIYELEPRE